PVVAEAERLAEKRRPRRTGRLAQQPDPALLGRPPALASIAVVARAHDVVPRRETALRTRHDVVEVELATRNASDTILAGVAVARVDVGAREAAVTSRYTIVAHEQDDPGNRHRAADETQRFARRAVLAPGDEVEGLVL